MGEAEAGWPGGPRGLFLVMPLIHYVGLCLVGFLESSPCLNSWAMLLVEWSERWDMPAGPFPP